MLLITIVRELCLADLTRDAATRTALWFQLRALGLAANRIEGAYRTHVARLARRAACSDCGGRFVRVDRCRLCATCRAADQARDLECVVLLRRELDARQAAGPSEVTARRAKRDAADRQAREAVRRMLRDATPENEVVHTDAATGRCGS